MMVIVVVNFSIVLISVILRLMMIQMVTGVMVYLEYDARCAHKHCNCKDPQEQTVHHHCYILPILDDLKMRQSNINTRSAR